MKATVHLDLGYLWKITELGFSNTKIDFAHFSDAICGEWKRVKTYVYDCPPYISAHPTLEEFERSLARQRFYEALRAQPRFELRFGRLAYDPPSRKFRQKRVDALIITDIVRLASTHLVDAIVIASGDDDLVPAVQTAKDAGIVTILYHRCCYDEHGTPRTKASRELLSLCDEARVIDEELIDSSRLQRSRGTQSQFYRAQA